MKKTFLISVILLLSYYSNILGDSILKWSFNYEDTDSNHIITINPSFDWNYVSKSGSVRVSEKFWLPNLKTKWECSVTLIQTVNIPLVTEMVDLKCFYGGINKFPSVQTTLNCHYNFKLKSLTNPLFNKTIDSKIIHLQLLENDDNLNNVSMECDNK